MILWLSFADGFKVYQQTVEWKKEDSRVIGWLISPDG